MKKLFFILLIALATISFTSCEPFNEPINEPINEPTLKPFETFYGTGWAYVYIRLNAAAVAATTAYYDY